MKTKKSINQQLKSIKRKTRLQAKVELELNLLEKKIDTSFNQTLEKIEREKNEI